MAAMIQNLRYPDYDQEDFGDVWSGEARHIRRGQVRNLARGAVVGAAAGLAAGWVMTQFQNLWMDAEKKATGPKKHIPKHRQAEQGGDDATVKLAARISKKALDHRLTRPEKQAAGPIVHYAFSAIMGALYGALAEVTPLATAGFGTVFGSALFVGADELAVPALQLGPPPAQVPPRKHLYGWISHLVWGASTEAARRGLRAAV